MGKHDFLNLHITQSNNSQKNNKRGVWKSRIRVSWVAFFKTLISGGCLFRTQEYLKRSYLNWICSESGPDIGRETDQNWIDSTRSRENATPIRNRSRENNNNNNIIIHFFKVG